MIIESSNNCTHCSNIVGSKKVDLNGSLNETTVQCLFLKYLFVAFSQFHSFTVENFVYGVCFNCSAVILCVCTIYFS